MRILVTGSLGVLGTPLVRELEERGHDVWGCDLLHAEGQFHRADVANSRQLGYAFEAANPEAVYHLAAEFGRHNGELYTEQLWTTAMVGTRNVLELCADYGSHLIFASSSEVYGELDEEWLYETALDTVTPLHPNEYALSKWANERQILAFQQRWGLKRATRLRFFNAYGPGEPAHPYRSVVALFCDKALRGEALPVYEGYHRTFMHVDDFTPTLANVCEAELGHDVYNIGGTDYRSVEELAEIVVAEAGGDIDLIPEDKHNIRSKRPAIARARDDLGHDPAIRLEDGVPNTIDWMKERVLGKVHQ